MVINRIRTSRAMSAITKSFLCYPFVYFYIKLPVVFRQPCSIDLSPAVMLYFSPFPMSLSITHPLFHSRLKTALAPLILSASVFLVPIELITLASGQCIIVSFLIFSLLFVNSLLLMDFSIRNVLASPYKITARDLVGQAHADINRSICQLLASFCSTPNTSTFAYVWSWLQIQQEIWANAHETRDSISLISYAGCLGLSPVISAKIHSLSVRCSLEWGKIH